jgi:very-short-patch-repair endonuclease
VEHKLRALQRRARRQLGLFTYAQALDAGFSPRTISWMLERGRWHEIEHGVFRSLPAPPSSWQQRIAALNLSVDGVAFGQSAAALYTVWTPPKDPESLVERAERNRLRPGVHSTRSLPTTDIATVQGVRATMPARTICDAAASLTLSQVVKLVDAAVVRHLVHPTVLAKRALELRNSKRPGCHKVLLALAQQHPDLEQARNDWEALVVRRVQEHGLPMPELNHPVFVGGQQRFLDVAWPAPMCDLEFDGFAPHMVRTVFDDDRVRQNALVAAGWTVFRVTSRILQDDPKPLFDAIRAVVNGRGHEFGNMLPVS